MFLRFFSLAGLLFILFSACSSSDPESQCITALDCGPEQMCVDGTCIDKGTGDTGTPDDTSDTGDTADSDESPDTSDTGDSGMPDDPGDTGDTTADEDAPADDPCDPNPCTDVALSDGTCTAEGESYYCGCVSGYQWNSSACEDIDECSDELLNNCSEFADCTNATGYFICECRENYSGDGTDCTADTRQVSCTNVYPENASWDPENADGQLTQTWNGTDWAPAADQCAWVCNLNYSRSDNVCTPDSRTFNCTGKPAGADWNTVPGYTQTWSGTEWLPADTETVYNETPDTNSCRYKCSENFTWNGSVCSANTKTFTCADKPAGTEWNTVSSYTQSWNGSSWVPADSTTAYNTSSSSTECRYKCALNYTWNSSICAADTKNGQNCTGLPANASWNTVSSITQTWNGTDWAPSTAGSFNLTPSTAECVFKCNVNYSWNGSACIADTKTFSCASKPAGTDWNTVSSYIQTWSGTEWLPAETLTTYSTEPSTSECRYKCALNYSWNGSSCIADTKTFSCAPKPAGTDWNTVSSYTQTWNGSAWSPADSATAYNETPDANSCRYKCTTDYFWDGSSCKTHECAQSSDCTADYNRPVCDTSVNPRKCVMCFNDSNCNTAIGERCDTSLKQCWSGLTCQNAVWSLPNSGSYNWDDGNQSWLGTGNYWGRETYRARSASYSWGYYDANYYYSDGLDETSRISGYYDLTACTGCTVQASFYYTGWVESTSSDFDYIQARCSGDDGSNWNNDSTLKTQTWSTWSNRTWNMPAGCITNKFTFGMRFRSDGSNVEDGMLIDDLVITNAASTAPNGNFDGITSGSDSYLWGWTCDPNDYNAALLVHLVFYKNGNTGNTPVTRWIRAGVQREQAVGDVCGGNRNHGFQYSLDPELKAALGSGTHSIYAYGIDVAASTGLCGGKFYSFSSMPRTFTLP